MSQDFQKLQAYKDLGESLTRVWGFVNYDNEIELYDNLESAMAAARLTGEAEEVGEISVRTPAFWQLHKELFLADDAKELEEDEMYEDEDDDEYEDEPYDDPQGERAALRDIHNDLSLAEDEEYDDDDDDGHVHISPKYGIPATRPSTADIQARLKDLAKFKSALPQKQPATTVAATPVQTSVQTDEDNDPAPNNDGRLTCYACGEPTKIVDTGFSTYCVCTVCGR